MTITLGMNFFGREFPDGMRQFPPYLSFIMTRRFSVFGTPYFTGTFVLQA